MFGGYRSAPGESFRLLLVVMGLVPMCVGAPDAQGLTLLEHRLQSGWNLITVPIVPVDGDAQTVFAGLDPAARVYTNADGGRRLFMDDPQFPGVSPAIGYWVLCERSAILKVQGSLVETATAAVVPLHPGWNLIGSPWPLLSEWSDATVHVRRGAQVLDLTAAVDAEWIEGDLYGYDSTGQAYEKHSFVAGATVLPWRGYLLRSTIAGALLLTAPQATDPPPVLALTSPSAGEEVSGRVPIIGTASDSDLVEYIVDYAPSGSSDYTTVTVANHSVEDSTLAVFDTTLLLNGLYRLRLRATDLNGRTLQLGLDVAVGGNMKPGLFTVTFTDLEVPLPGLTIQVQRTYDSRNKRSADFGYGWTPEWSDVQIFENGTLGAGWQGTASGGPLPQYCIAPTRTHIVSIVLPDGRVQRFSAMPRRACNTAYPPTEAVLQFTPMGASEGVLAPESGNDLFVFGTFPGPVELVNYSDYTAYDPDVYRYTTESGVALLVSQATGLMQLTQPDGSTVVIRRHAVEHSSGRNIAFHRDEAGRITSIEDPDGRIIHYAYDERGDLVRHTDALGHTTHFAYDDQHLLIAIRDPQGRPVMRNEYDEDGRLIATTDARGNRTEVTHDVGGRRQAIVDPLGHESRFAYDDRGNVLSEEHWVTGEDGAPVLAVSTWEYDANDRIRREVDADGAETTIDYDANGNDLETVQDPGGLNLVTAKTYDSRNRLLAVMGPDGNVITFDYDDAGCCQGKMTAMALAPGLETRFEYDAAGRVTVKTDPLGVRTLHTYDGAGHLASEETLDASGARLRLLEYTYDARGNRLTETIHVTRSGVLTPVTTAYAYDAADRVIAVTDALGGVTRTAYDSGGRISASTDVLGRVIRQEYDDGGNLTRILYPDGSFLGMDYDGAGREIRRRDRERGVTLMAYDELGRLVRQTNPDGSIEQTIYTPGGRIAAEIDGNGNRIDHEYDAAGRRTASRFPEVHDASRGAPVRPLYQYEYDGLGRQTAVIDPNGYRTELHYNTQGLLTMRTFPDGATETQVYDPLGRMTACTDVEGRTTHYAYDGLGRLIAVALPPPAPGEPRPTTRYRYDEAGNLLELEDPNGRLTRFEYDALGRLVRQTLPLGQTQTTRTDAAGHVVAATDFAGRMTAFDYDVNGYLSLRVRPDQSRVFYSHSPTGRRASVMDASGTMTRLYDAAGRISLTLNPDGSYLHYAYDGVGSRVALDIPSGTCAYAVDALNRYTAITNSDGETVRYAYDAAGNRVLTIAPNGMHTEYTYDKRYRLTRLINRNTDGEILSSYEYTVSRGGNRTRVVEHTGRTVDYTYDGNDRLIRESIQDPVSGDRVIKYTYDAVGNRLTRRDAGVETRYVYDDNDRLVEESVQITVGALRPGGALERAGYSAGVTLSGARWTAGAILAACAAALLGLILQCGVAARTGRRSWAVRAACCALIPLVLLLSDMFPAIQADAALARQLDAMGSVKTYAYDANGNRLRVSEGASTNHYTYDSDNRLIRAEVAFDGPPGVYGFTYDEDGNRIAQSANGVRSTSLVDANLALSRVLEETSPAGAVRYFYGEDLVSMTRPGQETRYYLFDGQLSTRQLADFSQTVTDTYTYDAFGIALERTGTSINDYLYTGECYDPTLGFVYLRARHYDPGQGRFINRDPFGGDTRDPVSLHKYLYAGANPVNRWDPAGSRSLIELMMAFVLKNILKAVDFVQKVAAWCQASWVGRSANYVVFFSYLLYLIIAPRDAHAGFKFAIKNRLAIDLLEPKEVAVHYFVKSPAGHRGATDLLYKLVFQWTFVPDVKIETEIGPAVPGFYATKWGTNIKFVVKICLIELLDLALSLRTPVLPKASPTVKLATLGLSVTIFETLRLSIPLVAATPSGWSFGAGTPMSWMGMGV